FPQRAFGVTLNSLDYQMMLKPTKLSKIEGGPCKETLRNNERELRAKAKVTYKPGRVHSGARSEHGTSNGRVPGIKTKSRSVTPAFGSSSRNFRYITSASFSNSFCRLSIVQPAPSTRLAAVRAASGDTP